MKAFPRPRGSAGGKYNEGSGGMDLRDYFAAKAMQGELSASVRSQPKPDDIACFAYKVADAMIEQRAK